MGGLHQRGEDSVERPEHKGREVHDADADCHGAQQREEVNGFGPGHRLPDAVGDVDQGPDSGYGRGNFGHRIAENHHIVVENAENRVDVL